MTTALVLVALLVVIGFVGTALWRAVAAGGPGNRSPRHAGSDWSDGVSWRDGVLPTEPWGRLTRLP